MIEEKDKSIKLKLRFISYKIKYRKFKVFINRKISAFFDSIKSLFHNFALKRKAKLYNNKIENIDKNANIKKENLPKDEIINSDEVTTKVECTIKTTEETCDNTLTDAKSIEKSNEILKINEDNEQENVKADINDDKKECSKVVDNNDKNSTQEECIEVVDNDDKNSIQEKCVEVENSKDEDINYESNEEDKENICDIETFKLDSNEKKRIRSENLKNITNKISVFSKTTVTYLKRIVKVSILVTKVLLLNLIKFLVKFIKSTFKTSKELIGYFDFSNLGKKIKKAFVVCVFLCIVGIVTYFTTCMLNTPMALTKRYYNKISENLNVEYNNVIRIIMSDLNGDNIDDYVCLVGESVYDTAKAHIGNDNLINYKNVGIVCLDGSTNEKISYESDFIFYTDIDIEVLNEITGTYIFVNSISSQDVIFLKVTNDGIVDIVKNTFSDIPTGYDISCRISEEDNKKLIISLDKDENEYLADIKDEHIIDLEEKNIDISSYRYSYLKDKFSYFEYYDIDQDGSRELIGVQNILYSNTKFSSGIKTLGKVKVIFKLVEDKLIYNDLKIEF